jgi:CTD small phosphatase-like protein 2
VLQDHDDKESDIHRLHLIQTIQSLLYINSLPASLCDRALPHLNKVDIPHPWSPSQTKTLLFDLDETLAHCIAGLETAPYQNQHQIWITMEHNENGKMLIEDVPVTINIRPHVEECLKACADKY